ncbi:MAG TPA: Txe/YoeB family addiction module toxin [Bacteroidales bacterium]|jgi:toxin YoeB|nr:Txe/YoeB family addiction module toxin [Bacteroidales bacterium]
MRYTVFLTDNVKADIIKFRKAGDKKTLKKIEALLTELELHPTTGTGLPQPLLGDRTGQWSRRITRKHRLIYKIYNERVIVLVLSVWGHYDDK